ncbi:MAG: hypothetical protein K2W95_05470 [Candidatus Obscuribacterales bacterium]|nr:hypothetical protein [Candidatus Obscuribacterales bacterium]
MTDATPNTPQATPPSGEATKKPPVLSWEFVVLLLLFFALATIRLAQPTGSLAGRIAMEQDGFNLYSYNIKDNKVYAIAIGPRGGTEQERGVWVDKTGHFKIDSLPVGEYSLRVKVPGFSSAYENGIFVEEGKVTEMPDAVSLEISHPSVSVASNKHVFTTKENPSFWVSASDATCVRARVYRKDMLSLISMKTENNGMDVLGVEISPELSIYKPYNATDRSYEVFGKMKPVREWRRTVRPDSEDWAHEDFAFDQSLSTGDYFAVVEAANVKGETDWGLLWFSVTDMGLIVKQDPEKVLVRAIDLNTLKPLKGVDVEMLNRQSPSPYTIVPRGKYKTDANGFVTLNIKPDHRSMLNGTLMVCGFLGGNHAYGGMSAYSSGGDAQKTYFYTDRPVYRLGQTVYFKGIARTTEPDGFKNRGGGLDVQVKFEDPDNQEIWSGKVKTTSFGTFNGILSLPKEGKTGAYQITLTYPDGTADYERVEIDQYRKPEYKVEVIPLEERVSAGGKARARVRATYYFGAPVAHAKVKYSIYNSTDWSSRYRLKPRPDYYSYFDDWESSDSGEDYSGGGNYVTEGYVETDDSGEAIVQFDTKPVEMERDAVFSDAFLDRRYKVDVEVTDISRLSVLSSAGVSVTAGDFALFVDPAGYVVNAGQPISSKFSAIDYSGQPMSHVPVRLQLMRRVWDRVKHEYKGVHILEEITLNTDAKGEGRVSFETKAKYETDTYYIVATSKDAEGHNIATSDSLWIASENYPYVLGADDAKKEPLQVKLDKPVYEPGDKARIMITAPVTGSEGSQAIVTLEGPKLYKYQVIDLKATASMVEIPVEKQFAPNVYVGVTFVGAKHQFYSQTQMIKVSPKTNFLNLEVKTDKPKYKPGDTVTYTIKATDSAGKPAPKAELSLGVVDESIYAIRAEYVADIRKFFYSQRGNAVSTMCSFPEENSGGPNKIEPKVRKDFKDTAIWMPNLVTDEQGLVTAKVKLPDNLTTWRATVRGVTTDTKVGSAIQKIVSTQDLIVRLALPRFFCQGDEGLISAIVHNYSDVAQDITLTLDASKEFQILNKGLQDKVHVEPEKAARVSWPTKIVAAGTGIVNVKAIGQTEGDAMEVKLPVRPLGVPVFVSRSGYLDADDVTATLPVEYPSDASAGSVKTTVSFASSSLGPVLGNFSSLIEYPYGCTEQTMSRLMPAVVAMQINRKLGAPLDRKDSEKFSKVYEMAMEKLRSYHHSDGGWGWWPHDESNLYLTSIVLEGFHLLEDCGYNVDADESGQGVSWIKVNHKNAVSQLTDPLKKKDLWSESELINDLAKSSYVLTLYKEKMSPEVKSFLCSDALRNKLAPEALAYLTMALKTQGDTALAQKSYERLITLANVVDDQSGGTLNWERTNAMYEKLAPDKKHFYYYNSYRYTGVETTALALRACLVMEPANTPRLESIKRWISLERGKDGWGNTKTTAEVFRAFTEDEIVRASRTGEDGVLTDFQTDVAFADKRNLNFGFTKSSMFRPEQTMNVALKPGTAKPSVHKFGKGRLYWTVTQSYYKTLKPGDTSLVQGMPDGLNIRREFLRLVASKPDADGNVTFKQEPIKDGKVKAGETLLMKLFVDAPLSVPYIMMEAALPSGAEVVSSDPRENLSSGDNEGTEINTDDEFGSWWWSHQDVLDDKIAYFVTSLPNGKHEIHTMVRLELPGKFQLNPVYMEGMYTDKVRAYSTADQITVLE